jgi:alginate O-acetyltransferase complex protein AlgI
MIIAPPVTVAAALDLALWLAGLAHYAVLGASFQVPARLHWREELSRLSPLNRKLMWTYGGFTVLTIVACGTLTLVLHDEIARGDRSALALAGFIGVYWGTRIGVDLLYFSHADWPRGRWLGVGHALLLALFVFLAGTYLGVVAWHLVR